MKRYDTASIRDAFDVLSERANESLGMFDEGSIGMGRYVAGSSPWERHNNGDELLLVTDGEADGNVQKTSRGLKKGLQNGIVTLLSVGACPQQNSPCKVLGFCKETAFSGTFTPGYSYFSDFQRNNTQEGDYPSFTSAEL
jgi:hypothetical protein